MANGADVLVGRGWDRGGGGFRAMGAGSRGAHARGKLWGEYRTVAKGRIPLYALALNAEVRSLAM